MRSASGKLKGASVSAPQHSLVRLPTHDRPHETPPFCIANDNSIPSTATIHSAPTSDRYACVTAFSLIPFSNSPIANIVKMGDVDITTSAWRYVELGRVVIFGAGPYEGRLATIVEIIDHKRVCYRLNTGSLELLTIPGTCRWTRRGTRTPSRRSPQATLPNTHRHPQASSGYWKRHCERIVGREQGR